MKHEFKRSVSGDSSKRRKYPLAEDGSTLRIPNRAHIFSKRQMLGYPNHCKTYPCNTKTFLVAMLRLAVTFQDNLALRCKRLL